MTQDALVAFMGSAGAVVSAEIGVNSAGKSKGYATCKYDSAESALNAVKTLNGTELEGRKITVRQGPSPSAAAASKAPAASAASSSVKGGNVYIGNLAYAGEYRTDIIMSPEFRGFRVCVF